MTTETTPTGKARPDHVDEVITAWQRELPGVAGLPLEVAKRTSLLNHLFEKATQRQLARFGLTPADYGVLATLRRVGTPYRLKPTELSNAILLTSGGTANVLRRLTQLGLVSRTADATDGRSTWVQLTEQGLVTAEQAVEAATTAHARLLDQLPSDTAELLNDLLRRTLNALDNESSGI
ncbi:MarR family winged helix-turn-helix transcriptional regulator [Streptomyces cucumeris]|uniref:MarR family winged helix-turn-helix transcriptional regulator n=1 Tax=Streptomyces cucumeris TaxID=2962890 RepID=UPI003D737E6B